MIKLIGGPMDGMEVDIEKLSVPLYEQIDGHEIIFPTMNRRRWIAESEYNPGFWGWGEEHYAWNDGRLEYVRGVGELVKGE